MARRPVKIFISYATDDESSAKSLEKHLQVYVQRGEIEIWHEGKILGGTEISAPKKEAIESAAIFVFLISAEYFSSTSLSEMESALQRHETDNTPLIAILVRAFNWEESPISKMTILPEDKIPIKSLQDHDGTWRRVAQFIGTVSRNIIDPTRMVRNQSHAAQDTPAPSGEQAPTPREQAQRPKRSISRRAAAGVAFLTGIVFGVALGSLPRFKGTEDDTALEAAADGGTAQDAGADPKIPPVILVGSGTVSQYLRCVGQIPALQQDNHIILESGTMTGISVINEVYGAGKSRQPNNSPIIAMAARRIKADNFAKDGSFYEVQIANRRHLSVTFGVKDGQSHRDWEKTFMAPSGAGVRPLRKNATCLKHDELEQWISYGLEQGKDRKNRFEVYLSGVNSGTRHFLTEVMSLDDKNTRFSTTKDMLNYGTTPFDLRITVFDRPWIAIGDYISGDKHPNNQSCRPLPISERYGLCSKQSDSEPATRGFFLYGQMTLKDVKTAGGSRRALELSDAEWKFLERLFEQLKQHVKGPDLLFLHRQFEYFRDPQARTVSIEERCDSNICRIGHDLQNEDDKP